MSDETFEDEPTFEEMPLVANLTAVGVQLEVGGRIGKWVANGARTGHYDVQALLAEIESSRWMQAKIAEARTEALREAADALDRGEGLDIEAYADERYADWLRARIARTEATS